MTLQSQLFDYEARLADVIGDLSAWTWQDVRVHHGAIVFDRLYRNFDNGDRLHVHCIPPSDIAAPVYLHAHGQASAIHIVGPASSVYELGWGVSDVLHARSVHAGPFYYEMCTGHVQHTVRALGPDPVYTVMLWTAYPEVSRGADLSPKPAPLTTVDDRLLPLLVDTFELARRLQVSRA